MNILAEATYTPDDLLHLPDADRYELINGKLVEKDMGSFSSWVGGEMYGLLRAYCRAHNLGWVFPADNGFQCFPEARKTVRKPDVSFVRRGRYPGGIPPQGHTQIRPDLAVEVVSPNDLAYEVEQTVSDYLAVGVPLVWVVSPLSRIVYVYRGDGSIIGLRENQEISGEDVVPGFRCRVSDFFPAPEAPAPEAPPAAANQA